MSPGEVTVLERTIVIRDIREIIISQHEKVFATQGESLKFKKTVVEKTDITMSSTKSTCPSLFSS